MGQMNEHPLRRSPRALRALALVLGVATLAPAWPAAAQPKDPSREEARSRYERGKQLYEEGAFDAALIEFQRAYDLAPSYKILFNIGQVHRQRNDYASALRVFERYLKEGGAEVDARRRGDIEKEINQLKGRVATLQISANVAGAEILVDDETVGKTPLPQGILVNSGKRKITALKEGRAPVSKVINVAGADSMKVALELAEPIAPPASASAAPAPPAPPPVAPEKSSSPWLAWTLTGAFGIGAAVTGILAIGASNDLKDKRSQPDVSRKDLDDNSSRTRTLALVSDLLLVGTVVAGGAAVYFTLRDPPREQTSSPRGPLRLGVSPGSVLLSGSF